MSKTVLENISEMPACVPSVGGYSALIEKAIQTTRAQEGTSIHLNMYYTIDNNLINTMIIQALEKNQLEVIKFQQRYYESICESVETLEKCNKQILFSRRKSAPRYPNQRRVSMRMRNRDFNGFQLTDVTKDAGEAIVMGQKILFTFNIIRFTIHHSEQYRTLIDMIFLGDVLYTSVCCDRYKSLENMVVPLDQLLNEWKQRSVSNAPSEVYKKDFLPQMKNQYDTVFHFRPNPTLTTKLIEKFESGCTVEEFEILSRICQCVPLKTIYDFKSLVSKLKILKNSNFISQVFYPIELTLRFLTVCPLTDFFGTSSMLRLYLPAYFGNKIAKRQLIELCEEYEFTVETDHFMDAHEYSFCSNFLPKNALSNIYCASKYMGDDAREICTYVFRYWTNHRHEDMIQLLKKAFRILNLNVNPIPFLNEWRAICCYLYAFLEKDKDSVEYLKSIDSPLYYHYLSLNSSQPCKYRKESLRRGLIEDGVNEVMNCSDSTNFAIKHHHVDRLSFGNEEWVSHMISHNEDDVDYEHLVNHELIACC
ncbi:Hypothetical protein NAEGRDRAFT_78267 [Naegleria gruberi]|uniref:Uncharacterized protein n=1 Tax=Naegleria gruberi TaxID=5762 RepID=D2V2B5_NAEGR|nr:uncharacterized protein NAEGRDRAFT_78267 [Naegleria gruberi]EFC49028.1 Hypothetical protein NAEGRDRAFT_78267 [Naegleria gruberi]|eukprot:XP_002681772.1 Hypothetical protein NAEGRDRAFT_78267 [Naegleria gruberi strain NEG-M]